MISDEEREKTEIEFWRDSDHERPESNSLGSMINKMGDCGVFVSILEQYKEFFTGNKTVLELGGGQGWACGALKRMFPDLNLILTDISEYAVLSKFKWEKIFGVSIGKSYACKSYEMQEENDSLDIIFCFAAAHHFTEMEKTMKEIFRVLKTGGHCFFFHEPSVIRLLHKMAHARVNKNRPEVPEDVLVYKEVLETARRAGLEAEVRFNPTTAKRGPLETVYYFILSKAKVLQRTLPCSANFHFKKI